jgi:predicted transcriptional regulator
MWARIAILLNMKTVQMTLDEDLVNAVDQVAQTLGTTRSAFTRDALREALARVRERDLERRHREGYERKPVEPGEFGDWDNEQVWGD